MIRLADFLFRQSGDPTYAQYIEYNLYNGIMAQAYYQEYGLTGSQHNYPRTGLLTYFLPMKAGLRKEWSTETDSFFCCHGTMVQANAAWNMGIYYQDGDIVYISQYFDSELLTSIAGTDIRIVQTQDKMSGSLYPRPTRPGTKPLMIQRRQMKIYLLFANTISLYLLPYRQRSGYASAYLIGSWRGHLYTSMTFCRGRLGTARTSMTFTEHGRKAIRSRLCCQSAFGLFNYRMTNEQVPSDTGQKCWPDCANQNSSSMWG